MLKILIDLTPELTLREAIEKGFGASREGDSLYYYHEQTDKNILLNEDNCFFILDENTQKQINQQLKNNSIKSIYDIVIRPGMNVQIVTPEYLKSLESAVKNLLNSDKIDHLKPYITLSDINKLEKK